MKKISITNIVMTSILLTCLVGGIIVIYTTMKGSWGYTDPVVYISTARNILNGNGIGYFEANAQFNPLSQYPPFIPILLSIIGAFKVDLIVAFRWTNIIAFIATIFLSGWIFLRYTNKPVFGIMTSVMIGFFPIMVIMFSSTYSEPLFILLIMAGGMLILEYFKNEKVLFFILAVFIIGLVPLTRYIGVSILTSTVLVVFLFTKGSIQKRIGKATIFGFLASIPTLLWLLRVYFLAGPAVGKWSVNPNVGDIASKFQDFRGLFMDTISKWPPFQSITISTHYSTRYIILGVGVFAFVVISLVAYQRSRLVSTNNGEDGGFKILAFFGISTMTFLVFLVISYIFSHPSVAIDNRMLLPFYVCSVMCLFGGFALWQQTWFQKKIHWLQITLCILIVIWVWLIIPVTINAVKIYHSGIGLTANNWRKSETILAVSSLPGDQTVISNDWELLQLWTGRPILGFWNTYSTNPDQAVFCKKGAALVLFSDFQEQFIKKYGQESLKDSENITAGLQVFGEYSDGIVYLCR